MLHMSSSPPCFEVLEKWDSARCLVDKHYTVRWKKSPAQHKTKFPSITCSYLLCDCIWLRPPVCTKGHPWPRLSGKLLHHFRTRKANLRQTCGAWAGQGARPDSLFEQSRLLLSKLKHIPKRPFQGSPSSRLNHHMLKCPDLSAQRHQLPQGETQRSTTRTKPWTSLYPQALLEWWILLLYTHLCLHEA